MRIWWAPILASLFIACPGEVTAGRAGAGAGEAAAVATGEGDGAALAAEAKPAAKAGRAAEPAPAAEAGRAAEPAPAAAPDAPTEPDAPTQPDSPAQPESPAQPGSPAQPPPALKPPWPTAGAGGSLASRVPPPPGYRRLPQAPGSFGDWLRRLPTRPGRPQVHLHDGRTKGRQDVHHLVLDIDVGRRDLQQCADAVMRLRAEWLRHAGRQDDVCFRFTSGDPAAWRRWRGGERPQVRGSRVSWQRSAEPDASYRTFRRYLDTVFMYAGSASLEKELKRVPDPSRVQPGDVYIQGGHPGHAVLVVDVAQSPGGERVFLLAQSYMPAQEIHVLRNPAAPASPWYAVPEADLVTPEWTFRRGDLMRFGERGCPGR